MSRLGTAPECFAQDSGKPFHGIFCQYFFAVLQNCRPALPVTFDIIKKRLQGCILVGNWIEHGSRKPAFQGRIAPINWHRPVQEAVEEFLSHVAGLALVFPLWWNALAVLSILVGYVRRSRTQTGKAAADAAAVAIGHLLATRRV